MAVLKERDLYFIEANNFKAFEVYDYLIFFNSVSVLLHVGPLFSSKYCSWCLNDVVVGTSRKEKRKTWDNTGLLTGTSVPGKIMDGFCKLC